MSKRSDHLHQADPALIFAALGDGTRLALVARLSDGQARSIAKLSGDTRLSRQAITKHLHVLENAGLVSSTRAGRESQYALEAKTIADASAYLDRVSQQWDDALSRLRSFVEG